MVVLGGLFVVGLLLPLAYSITRPTLTDRNLIYLLPLFLLGVASGLEALLSRTRIPEFLALVGIFLFAAGHLQGFYQGGENRWKPDWRDAASLIQSSGQPGERVLVPRGSSRFALAYYLCPGTESTGANVDVGNPSEKRIWSLDQELARRLKDRNWQGWLLLEFGNCRDPSLDSMVESFRASLPTPQQQYYSPHAGNGLALYHLNRKN
jgi:hypothetical protein